MERLGTIRGAEVRGGGGGTAQWRAATAVAAAWLAEEEEMAAAAAARSVEGEAAVLTAVAAKVAQREVAQREEAGERGLELQHCALGHVCPRCRHRSHLTYMSVL